MKKIYFRKVYKNKIKKIFFLVIVLLSFHISFSLFINIKLYSSNEDFIINMLRDSNYYTKYQSKNIVLKIANYIYNLDIKKPITLIENSFDYDHEFDEEYNPEVLEETSKYISDPNPIIVKEPIVYIYNSHQLENYDNSNYKNYNITPNVMMASYMLKEKLNDLGISTIVEEGNITEFIRINNWTYDYSYLASRYFINSAIENNKSLKYFIDIHRDSINKSQSTVTINNKKYAKILFVVGLEHKDYRFNLDLANSINEKIRINYPSLTRGVITKQGRNVNGIYNQDISHNSMLIEIGGFQNKIEEVLNTIEILSNVLKDTINERK